MEQTQTPQTEEQTPRAWVTPVVQQLELKGALSAPTSPEGLDVTTGYS